ncbi:hypothetical protein EYF80_034065 [Liparis tanakae]|uniref:Uncharacterized protein n=1 Tax=Liparis tanakae TaxID=230148 RepID=A0A4Z2GR34_9TELE|nr:hypothetical protein EYF80_034065 [Liparis tanakae]
MSPGAPPPPTTSPESLALSGEVCLASSSGATLRRGRPQRTHQTVFTSFPRASDSSPENCKISPTDTSLARTLELRAIQTVKCGGAPGGLEQRRGREMETLDAGRLTLNPRSNRILEISP